MSEPTRRFVSAAMEGIIDEAVLRRLLEEVGADLHRSYVARGKASLRTKVAGYNAAARRAPWVVLVDLDRDDCAAGLVQEWLPSPATLMRLRVAVPQVESWLLADAERMATFLGVSRSNVVADPDRVTDAKQALVELAAGSRRRLVRSDIVPRPRSGRRVGPAYAAQMIEFVGNRWRPGVAARRSPSLRRALNRLEELALA